MTYKTATWIYIINEYGYWAVSPTEGFNGVKKASHPGGGWFTLFEHAGDGFQSTSADFSWNNTLKRLSNDQSTGSASITFAGDIIDARYGVRSFPSVTTTFTFNQIYR